MHTRFSTQQAANMVARCIKQNGWNAEIAHLDIYQDPTPCTYETWKVALKHDGHPGPFSTHMLIASDEGPPSLDRGKYMLDDAVAAMLNLEERF